MPAKSGGVGPILTAIGGMFFVSLLDAAGMISIESALGLMLYYGVVGACGGFLMYTLIRWLRR